MQLEQAILCHGHVLYCILYYIFGLLNDCSFSLFSRENRASLFSLYLVCSGLKKSVNEDLSTYRPHSAPFGIKHSV